MPNEESEPAPAASAAFTARTGGDWRQKDTSPVALHRGPSGSRGPMIPPGLSLLLSPWSRRPIWGWRRCLGPRCGLYGPGGWWKGINAEPPFSKPVYGGPSRANFYEEHRNTQRLKSWFCIKNTCLPKDGPEVMEDKFDCPVCQPFAQKGHC